MEEMGGLLVVHVMEGWEEHGMVFVWWDEGGSGSKLLEGMERGRWKAVRMDLPALTIVKIDLLVAICIRRKLLI